MYDKLKPKLWSMCKILCRTEETESGGQVVNHGAIHDPEFTHQRSRLARPMLLSPSTSFWHSDTCTVNINKQHCMCTVNGVCVWCKVQVPVTSDMYACITSATNSVYSNPGYIGIESSAFSYGCLNQFSKSEDY